MPAAASALPIEEKRALRPSRSPRPASSEIDMVRPQAPEGGPAPGGWASLKLLLTNRALL
jgi:hypothetical protein